MDIVFDPIKSFIAGSNKSSRWVFAIKRKVDNRLYWLFIGLVDI